MQESGELVEAKLLMNTWIPRSEDNERRFEKNHAVGVSAWAITFPSA